MYGGGRADDSPSPPQSTVNDGELLLRLVQNRRPPPPPQQPPSLHHPFHSSSQSNLSLDPAVAVVGPSIPIPLPRTNPNPNPNPNPNFLSHGIPQNTPWPTHHSPSPPPHTTSFFSAPHHHYDLLRQQQQRQKDSVLFGNIPLHKTNFSFDHLDLELNKEPDLGFGFGPRAGNGFDPNHRIDPRVNWAHGSPEQRRPGPGPNPGPPPGFQRRRSSISELSSSPSEFSSNNHSERDRRVLSRENGVGLSGQLDRPGFPTGSAFHLGSGSGSGFEKGSLLNVGGHVVDNGVSQDEVDELSEQLVDSVLGENESNEKNDSSAKKKYHRDKDFRSDARGKWILSQKMRNSRRLIECRRDIDKLNANFLAIYKSLIPEKEEKEKQKQLVTLLENLVRKEWPNASLYVYGSCANSFGVSKSDIDICLALDDQDIINKSEVLLKLADILESDNLQNVQALTRARVPIVKLMDPGTGISCDICINNLLAVVNTKLLHDYAEIDVRLRQLAFLVKHWAKSRGVNETYQGTLSSYAYVLMCIHFLQLRHPPILPCLQGMEATCIITVDDVKCAYFDKVERLRDFGAQNKEGIAQLLWAFFNYWAYCHDYANSVISIRTGSILRKHEKDWTRRIGNDRHLICIEDPFETSHDLGRVVDKYSIRVLREEFERAAEIMQYDPNPCVTLFQPYVPFP